MAGNEDRGGIQVFQTPLTPDVSVCLCVCVSVCVCVCVCVHVHACVFIQQSVYAHVFLGFIQQCVWGRGCWFIHLCVCVCHVCVCVFLQEMISLIKQTKIPIIFMCNDRNHQKIRSLANYCFDLRFQRPRVEQIKAWLTFTP